MIRRPVAAVPVRLLVLQQPIVSFCCPVAGHLQAARCTARIPGMRTSAFVLGAMLVGCGEQKFTAVNAEPDVTISTHGHGDVVGTGARRLYLARAGQNHFIPLFLKGPLSARG